MPRQARSAATVLAALLSGAVGACGPDRQLDLLPDDGSSGTGGTGDSVSTSSTAAAEASTSTSAGTGGAAPGCHEHSDCEGVSPWCDLDSGGCAGCPAGLEQCGALCVDLARDASHCGGCFSPCAVGETCDGSSCTCQPGLERCGEACVELASDPNHCSGCDHPCPDGTACEGGHCIEGPCAEGLTACPVDEHHAACVDLQSGPRCGACAIACGPSEVCVAGSCREHLPATPCSTCPCADVCNASLGEHASCCEGVHGDAEPRCVEGDDCPG